MRLGVFGAVWFVGGFAWHAFWFYYVRVPDSPALTVDGGVPVLPRLITLLGFLAVVVSLAWAGTARIRRKDSGS